jgi:hypothetical protein
MNVEEISTTVDTTEQIELNTFDEDIELDDTEHHLASGSGSGSGSGSDEGDMEEDDSQDDSESFGESNSDSEQDMFSQQNLFYFQNMDQLLSNYFANEDTNIVNAIQNLDKSIKDFSSIIKESLEQNAKCTLRVAKILETASQKFSK